MGSVVFKCLKSKFDVIGIGKEDSLDLAKDADVVVDFGGADSSVCSASWCKGNNKKLIIGSTGQSEEQLKYIKEVSKCIPIVFESNFSFGIFLLKKISKFLSQQNVESITIVERHHKNKVDKPSGTAKSLCGVIKEKINAIVDVLSIRGGQEFGTHELNFFFDGELIKLTHQAFSRDCFAYGVMAAVDFILKTDKCGLFSTLDVFDNFGLTSVE